MPLYTGAGPLAANDRTDQLAGLRVGQVVTQQRGETLRLGRRLLLRVLLLLLILLWLLFTLLILLLLILLILLLIFLWDRLRLLILLMLLLIILLIILWRRLLLLLLICVRLRWEEGHTGTGQRSQPAENPESVLYIMTSTVTGAKQPVSDRQVNKHRSHRSVPIRAEPSYNS